MLIITFLWGDALYKFFVGYDLITGHNMDVYINDFRVEVHLNFNNIIIYSVVASCVLNLFLVFNVHSNHSTETSLFKLSAE